MVKLTQSFEFNGQVYHSREELDKAITVSVIPSYTCTDGKTFKHECDAKAHEENLQPQRVEIRDLLNQIVIIAEKHKDSNDEFVTNVKSYAEKVLKSSYEATLYEEQYYNSNCY